MPTTGPVASPALPDWSTYHQKTADRPPRRTTTASISHLSLPGDPASRVALDIGCGGGRDTASLLAAGLTVIAMDAAAHAGRTLKARFPEEWRGGRLTFIQRDFSDPDIEFSSADLINASFCLPSCPPERFEALWGRLVNSLQADGLFAGHFYGDRDSWAARGDNMTFHTRADIDARFRDWSFLLLEEGENDSVTPRGKQKHWHVFHIVARKSG